jgi:tetratricopeptide (TPR) repeat protein
MPRQKTSLAVIGALLSALILFASGPAWADGVDLAQASALIKAGKAKEAYELLAPHETANAGNPDYDFLLGLAAIETGNAVHGIFPLERVLAVNPDHADGRVAIARAHYMLGENEAAKQEFNNILELHPPEEAVKAIDRYMSAIDRAMGETTRFHAYLEATLGHDSNINGAPSAQTLLVNFNGLPLPVTLSGTTAEKSDNFFSMAGGASFSYPATKNLSLFGGVSGTNRINWSSNMFETSTLDFNLGLSHKLGPNTLTAALQNGNFRIDGERYRHSYGVAGQWQHNLDDRNQLSMFGQVLRLSYPGADIRDADRRLIGVGFGHAFTGDLSPVLFANVYAGEEDERASDRPDMGHDFYGVRTGGQISWNPKLVLFATANYENRDYGGTRPFFTKSQQDRQYEFSVGARYLPIPLWQIKPQLSYLNNDSNIPITDYDRWMVSVSFRHDFEW